MTWQEFIEKGAICARQLDDDPEVKLFIDGIELNLESLNFNLVKYNTNGYEDYKLVISN